MAYASEQVDSAPLPVRVPYVAKASELTETSVAVCDSVSFCESAGPALSYAASARQREERELAAIRIAVAEVSEQFWHPNQPGYGPVHGLLHALDNLIQATSERNQAEQRALVSARLEPIVIEHKELRTEWERVQKYLDRRSSSFTKSSLETRLDEIDQRLTEIGEYLKRTGFDLTQIGGITRHHILGNLHFLV